MKKRKRGKRAMKKKYGLKIRGNTHKTIGSYFRTKRIQAGLKQEKVAKTLGYKSIQIVSNWERGLCSPPVKVLKKLCRLYKIDKPKLLDFLVELEKRKLKKILGIRS